MINDISINDLHRYIAISEFSINSGGYFNLWSGIMGSNHSFQNAINKKFFCRISLSQKHKGDEVK